jgi:hypothetical protein
MVYNSSSFQPETHNLSRVTNIDNFNTLTQNISLGSTPNTATRVKVDSLNRSNTQFEPIPQTLGRPMTQFESSFAKFNQLGSAEDTKKRAITAFFEADKEFEKKRKIASSESQERDAAEMDLIDKIAGEYSSMFQNTN